MWWVLLWACTPATTGPVEVATPPVDCSTPPDFELGETMAAPRANRSLLLYGDRLLGWDGYALHHATSPVDSEVFIPGITAYGGMVELDDGTLMVSEHLGNEDVLRIHPNGGWVPIVRAIRAYGLIRGPDGAVYATSEQDVVYRIDPDTEEAEVWLTMPEGVQARLSAFSPDASRLYIGTRNEDGGVWTVELDDDLQPVGDVERFVQTSGYFHDLLLVDSCGALYMTAYGDAVLTHITPEGVQTPLADLTAEEHIHGGGWGTGQGAWDDRTLYLAHPNLGNRVSAWPIGRGRGDPWNAR